MKRPTQVDVARIAGVSRATVSYVLNDQTDQRIPISPETRLRVLNAIAELGYEVDARAQALRSGDTKTIGVLLPIYENPFFWQILRGISAEAESSGYSLLLAHNPLTPEKENQSIKELAEQRVDGLVLMVGFKQLSHQIVNQLLKSSRPVVEIAETAYGLGAQALIAHLVEQGHRRIGLIYGVALPSQGFDRLEGYRLALQDAGILFDESLIYECGPFMEDGYQAAVALLSQANRPTALLAINDLLAIATMRAAEDMGLHIPEDVSVAGFDDIPFADYMIPRLTTIASEPEQGGREAVRLLLKRINEPDYSPTRAIMNWQLHLRESTGQAPTTIRRAKRL